MFIYILTTTMQYLVLPTCTDIDMQVECMNLSVLRVVRSFTLEYFYLFKCVTAVDVPIYFCLNF